MVGYLDLQGAEALNDAEFGEGPGMASIGLPKHRFGLISAMLTVAGGAALLLFRSTPSVSTISGKDVVGFAAVEFTDKGYGKCTLEDGGDPKHAWKGSGDVRAMCAANDECVAYSASNYGGGLLWLAGPVKGGGAAWGGCHCHIKVKAEEATPAPAPVPMEPPPTLDPATISQTAEAAAAATEFPNAHLIASGYNIFFSDPLPVIEDRTASDVVNMDPGLRKPVFAIEYTTNRVTGDRRHKRPDGFFATVDYGCSEVFSTKTVSDTYEFTSERNLEASQSRQVGLSASYPPGGGDWSVSVGDVGFSDPAGTPPISASGFVGVTGTMSGSYKTVKKDNILQDNRLVISNAQCAVYTAGIAYGYPPKTHPDFQQALDNAKNKAAWYRIFDTFGTHFFSNLKMGARFGTTMIFGKSHYDAMTHTMAKAGVEVSAVVSASVALGVAHPDIPSLSLEFDAKVPLPEVSVMDQKQVKNLTSFASSQTMQGIGPMMPKGGASAWMEAVEKNPVPLRFSKQEICAHPGLTVDQVKSCADAMSTYCKEHLEAQGAECEPPEKRQCQLDDECDQGYVCREFQCHKVPICYVSVFSHRNHGGEEFTLDPVDAISNPDGKPTSLKANAWHDKIHSFRLGKGCEKVKLYDDDPGNFFEGEVQNREFSSSQNSLEDDLEEDVWQIWVRAKDVPGTPPFQPGQGTDPGSVGKPPPITYNPEKDTMFTEPPQAGSGLAHGKEEAFFPNIGKAMYGYNHFFGAPMSTKNAGTDPGFTGRPVWQLRYKNGAIGQEGKWNRLPMAPRSRYFVIFAAKHPQIDQMQEDVKNPLPAAKRKFKGTVKHLEHVEQQFKDGKKSWWEHNQFKEKHWQREEWQKPTYPVHTPDNEYCVLKQQIFDLIGRIDGLQVDAPERQSDDDYSYFRRLTVSRSGSTLRRLTDDVTHHDAHLHVGSKFCRHGKLREWTQADKDAAAEKKKEHDAALAAEWAAQADDDDYGYAYFWRRLTEGESPEEVGKTIRRPADEATAAEANSRRLYSEKSEDWFSWNEKPNMREFGSLARAKQALRSEAKCIGQFEEGFQCPSGNDYDLNVKGTTWDFGDDDYAGFYSYMMGVDYVDPKEKMRRHLRHSWPRFIVKVSGDEIDEMDTIDAQDQRKGLRSGFDSVLPADQHIEKMLEFLRTHIKDNPNVMKTIEDATDLEKTQVPDGWKVTRAKGGGFCEQDMKTDQITDAHSYEKVTSSTFGIPTTAVSYGDLPSFSFGLSYEKKATMKNSGQKNEKMFSTQAECGTYFAQLVDLENKPPETEASLAYLVSRAKEETDFHIIFDQYGLHFPTEMLFGARYGTTQFIKQSSFQEYQSTSESLSLDFGVGVTVPTKVPGVDMTFQEDTSIGYSGTESEAHSSQKYFNERRTFSVGKRLPAGGLDDWLKDISGEAMPIKFNFVPICFHPVFKEHKALCETASGNYCEKHLRRLHPEVTCGESSKTECLWDIDCQSPHTHRCTRSGQCVVRPSCSVTLFEGGNYNGVSYVLGPHYYSHHHPYKIYDLSELWPSWKGRTKSMKISGGCGKVVKMSDANLNAEGNYVKTNHKSNDEAQLGGVRHCNWVALYPKEYFVDEGSEWFAPK